MPDRVSPELDPLFDALRALIDWFDSEEIQGVVIGGVAASLLGRPRTTADVDALVMLEETGWESFLRSGEAWGIRQRIEDALSFAAQSRVLLLRHEPSGVDVDVSLGALPFEDALVREARTVEVSGLRVPLPRVEDLVVMKAVAHRGRDLADIEALLEVHPDADLAAILEVVREFSDVLEMPEILTDLQVAIRRSR